MKFLIFVSSAPTGCYVEADSKEDACKKLGVRIADPLEASVVGEYHLKVGKHELNFDLDEIKEISSNEEIVNLIMQSKEEFIEE